MFQLKQFINNAIIFQDLIHGAPIGKPAANKAKVTAVYVEENGAEIHFSRIIHGSTSEYHINKRVSSRNKERKYYV